MLSVEQIENIIKSKYKDLKIENFFNNLYTFKFDFERDKEEDWTKWKEIALNTKEKDKIFYEENELSMDELYNYKKFEIENNAIELKHLLNIEITKQDIIDWVKTFKNYHNTLKIHVVIKYLYISINDEKEQYFYIKENRKGLSFYTCENFDKKSVNIFTAENSQEYWQLYNIIKNLKG